MLPEAPTLAADPRVGLWTIRLEAPAAGAPETLSPDELERAARFHFEIHRQRFIAARGALRLILGACLDTDPAALVFRYTVTGKPFLAGRTIRFNVSHSAGHALIAVAHGREVGIDLEETQPKDDLLALAERFFASSEHAAVAAALPEDRPSVFYRIWTRKEAYMKARGDGLSLALDSFAVPAAPDTDAALLASPDGPAELARWQLLAIPSPPGFAAALVIERGPVELDLHIV